MLVHSSVCLSHWRSLQTLLDALRFCCHGNCAESGRQSSSHSAGHAPSARPFHLITGNIMLYMANHRFSPNWFAEIFYYKCKRATSLRSQQRVKMMGHTVHRKLYVTFRGLPQRWEVIFNRAIWKYCTLREKNRVIIT